MKKKPKLNIMSLIAMVLVACSFISVKAQPDLIAIDVLLDPDQTMIDSAKFYNNLMLQDYSGTGSFTLDANHNPHITVLQCFVKRADLEKVNAAVTSVVENEKPLNEELTTSGFYYVPLNGLGLAGITAKTTPKLLSFQSKIIAALKPFIEVGTNAGFVQNADGKEIAAGLKEYVNAFVSENSGARYNPHVTIGLAREDFLKALLAKPYNAFRFKNVSVSIYQLGDFGTAQKKLWTSLTH
jgi:hypothetical protein